MDDELNNLKQAQDMRANQAQTCNAGIPGGTYRPSLREEAQKRAHYHGEEINKAWEAANFFEKHPEFDEFIRLIRSGAIRI